VVRRILFALLALGPLATVLGHVGAAGNLTLFPLAAAALVPLAWLIGEATEQAAKYTGAGIGGFLNASFGNAPELIIALVAVSKGLTDFAATATPDAAVLGGAG
jgi:Ca2+:H+ antiporter